VCGAVVNGVYKNGISTLVNVDELGTLVGTAERTLDVIGTAETLLVPLVGLGGTELPSDDKRLESSDASGVLVGVETRLVGADEGSPDDPIIELNGAEIGSVLDMPVEIAIVLETPEPIEAIMDEISELSGVAIL
jgi:hypothetical protein